MKFAARTGKVKATIQWAQALAKGEGVINLTQGKPNINPPENVIEFTKKKLEEPWASQYTPSTGLEKLKDMIKGDLRKFDTNVEDVIVTCGGAEAGFIALMGFVDPGDEVVLISPFYPKHKGAIMLANGKPVYSPYQKTEEGFVFDLAAFKRSITRKTKMVIINSPSNPTGAVFSKQDFQSILEVARENGIWIFYDEVYKTILFDGKKHYTKEIYDLDHTVISGSFSKTYSMSGFRIGYVAGAKAVLDKMKSIHATLTVCPPTPSQIGAIAALQCDPGYLQKVSDEYQKRRDVVLKRCAEIPNLIAYKPSGAMYVMLEAKDCRNDVKLVEDIVNKAKVGFVPGSAFGAVGMVRLSYSNVTIDQLNQTFDRLQEYFKYKYDKFLKSREKPY